MEERWDIWMVLAAGAADVLPVGRMSRGIRDAAAALAVVAPGTTVVAHRPRGSRLRPLQAVMEQSGLDVRRLAVLPSIRQPLILAGCRPEPMTYTANMLLALPPGSGRPEWFWALALCVARTRVGVLLLRRYAPRVLVGRAA